ncbi:DUF448 domain-containing protein [Kordiimonas sp. SCSIO 12610]|uniref:DUF448 domain-containing protein n=1 Tax=Kordiimonas sp. SCSIO 12610 TaxID=2829597 RepID=UPI00210A725B|nr:DUF448 domain-containing protein [Kordiimonas sp. SCSIO 12610]UTW55099.1 DUF448 domain-containing protein [Kordiimonas sp. SCSIO 12610]
MSETNNKNETDLVNDAFKDDKRSNDRTCIISGATGSKETLIRLVLGPDETLVPDLANKLPGRGLWISANRAILDDNIASGKFTKAVSRSLKASYKQDAGDLPSLIERLLTRRCLDRLGLEQRAGNIVTGFDKIKAETVGKSARDIIGYITASDSSDDGRNKMSAAMPAEAIMSSLFSREQLSQALGKDNVVHVAVFNSGGAKILRAELDRLKRYRGIPE